MKILSISSILPIPQVLPSNDFVFQTYGHYIRLFENDSVIIIRPVKLDLNPIAVMIGNTSLHRLNRAFTQRINGFQVEVMCFFSSWSFRNIHAIITSTIYWLNRKRIRSLFLKQHFDLIHAQFIFPDALLACMLHRRYKIPYVVTTHNERFYFEHCISKKIAVNILKNASSVFPINHSNYSYFKSIGIPNVELIPLGFSRSFIREQKAPSSGIVRILTVAELIKLKNIDKVILALKGLYRRYRIAYTVIGRGPELDSLQKLVDSSGLGEYVVFIDSIPHNEIADEMYKHDIYIMPSYFETFGRVYFEAMAMGIPIICARNSGIYGIFREGEEGFSVDHTKVDEIEKTLEYLIADEKERSRIGMNGKKLVEQFTWEHIAGMLHDRYLDVVAASKNSSQ